MTDGQMTTAILAWIAAAVPEVAPHQYDYLPGGKPKGLPDVATELESRAIVNDDPDFRMLDFQQAALRVRRYSFSFMVDAGTDETGQRAADALLRTFADRLETALFIDLTLGGRITGRVSPFVRFDYTPPLVQYEDGTLGRQMTMALGVAEPIRSED